MRRSTRTARLSKLSTQHGTAQSDDTLGLELVARARELKATLHDCAFEAEAQRRVPSDSFEQLRASGLLRAYIPKRFGGYEIPPRWFWRIAAELSSACPSTGWVYSVLSCHTYLFAMFPERAQEEIFTAYPDAAISGVLPDKSTAKLVDGGVLMKSGLWPFGSGCHNAEWAILGVELEDHPPGYNKIFCMVPMAEIEIVDDWKVTGLKATGSNSLRLKAADLLVPTYRTLKAEVALAHKYGEQRTQLYRTPMAPVLSMSLGLGTTIGAARGALEYFEELVMHRSERPMIYTTEVRKSELPATLRTLAAATARLDSACLLADHACDLAWAFAGTPKTVLDMETRARLRLYGVHVMHECREIVNLLFLQSGGSALHERSPIQRFNRDVQAMTMHEMAHLDMMQNTYGQVRLNQPTNHWLL
ncbi:MAG: alkylation response protein AidB-like acyl-CoA dehydrogenase [Gammaproteobacteria bacterium]